MLDAIDAMETQGIEITETALISRLHLSGHQQVRKVLDTHRARRKRPAVVEVEASVIPISTKGSALEAVPTLEDYEAIIEEGVKAAFRAGEALLQIRDKGLFEKTHRNFEDYCRERFNIERSQAYRWMDAARVLTILSPIGDIPKPTSESQVRPLSRLEPDQQVEAWKHAVSSSAGGRLTAKHVQASVDSLFPSQPTLPSTSVHHESSVPSTSQEENGEATPDVEGESSKCGSTPIATEQLARAVEALNKLKDRTMPWGWAVQKDPPRFACLAQAMLECVVHVVTSDPGVQPGKADSALLCILEHLRLFFTVED